MDHKFYPTGAILEKDGLDFCICSATDIRLGDYVIDCLGTRCRIVSISDNGVTLTVRNVFDLNLSGLLIYRRSYWGRFWFRLRLYFRGNREDKQDETG